MYNISVKFNIIRKVLNFFIFILIANVYCIPVSKKNNQISKKRRLLVRGGLGGHGGSAWIKFKEEEIAKEESNSAPEDKKQNQANFATGGCCMIEIAKIKDSFIVGGSLTIMWQYCFSKDEKINFPNCNALSLAIGPIFGIKFNRKISVFFELLHFSCGTDLNLRNKNNKKPLFLTWSPRIVLTINLAKYTYLDISLHYNGMFCWIGDTDFNELTINQNAIARRGMTGACLSCGLKFGI